MTAYHHSRAILISARDCEINQAMRSFSLNSYLIIISVFLSFISDLQSSDPRSVDVPTSVANSVTSEQHQISNSQSNVDDDADYGEAGDVGIESPFKDSLEIDMQDRPTLGIRAVVMKPGRDVEARPSSRLGKCCLNEEIIKQIQSPDRTT